MLTPRTGHAAVRLLDGRVLIVGGTALGPLGPRDPVTGQWPTGLLASAELWDPTTGRFSATGRMTTARENATATLLDDGRVLIAGGTTDEPGGTVTGLASAELYDPRRDVQSHRSDALRTEHLPLPSGCLPGSSRPLATRLPPMARFAAVTAAGSER
jgi:hypothetical protein